MSSFRQVLDHIRATAESEARKGRLFERLMKTYFEQDPLYRERFAKVSLWSDWTAGRQAFDRADIGVDLVAEELSGGFCAVQCKCYAPGTRISKTHLDSFISASARDPFTARIVVDTGDEWGPNARRTLHGLKPECAVLRFGDLESQPFDWPDLTQDEPEALAYRRASYHLRPHQQAAFDKVVSGFTEHERGKLIMACGTGKTFTALRLAERLAGVAGRVLYLVPSISLFQQSMREWAEQRAIPHRYVGICSDTRAGRNDEDASLHELEMPVTTDPAAISKALGFSSAESMTVVFCTYHSLGLVEQAQDGGAPPFDLVLCDEAHRTTGVDRPGDRTSPFVLVHDGERIRARRRLYMTATPRLYTEGAKTKAARHDIEVFSMDDPATYGPEFHRLPFSRAVEQDLLSDYKVVVLAMSEAHIDAALQAHLATEEGSEINLTDAAKIVGCWQALRNPESRDPAAGPVRHLGRAIAFTNTIRASQRLNTHWAGIVEQAIATLPDSERLGAFRCETRHVDGQHHALDRKARIEWLKGSADGGCRILSNARCLSEGIDVPALDAVLFMSPRSSQVDIVQAVGRAMRKAEGKQYGYILLPVAVPAGVDPVAALNDNERFATVWAVLRALRSHDDRFDAEINQIDLNRTPTARVIFSGAEPGDNPPGTPNLPFPPLDLPPGAIYAKIVEKCGDRKYWETWARDVADIYSRLVMRIKALLDNPDNDALREWFAAFHDELKASINESIDTESAVDMMAQHIITRPVFEAVFDNYDFAAGNPVARALDQLRADFAEFGLENEVRDLERFYESVRLRARGLDNAEARQRVLMELYEKFFATALKNDADRLGIVYTPVEIVDFILASADHALREEFGRGLSDEGVHVLDPFTGTGIFLVRLIQSALIRDADLVRKYGAELHANELVLLAYYIAAVHIEEAFRGRTGGGHQPFEGIVLTDTFNLLTERELPGLWLPDNSERAERQRQLPIQVIVGNPPWSAGQRSSADDNPNVDYPELEARVAQTYAARSTATLKNSLYDSYKMAIRWASDRIGDQGVVAFVTNGSWIDGNVDSGVRACLAEEFSSVHVLNLRGNLRTQGDRSKREGGNVFDVRVPVAITVLVRNSQAEQQGCRILYRDIGDYLSRQDKLGLLREWQSIAGVPEWREITPDRHHDWIGQRDEKFQKLYPVGSKETKAGRSNDAIFRLFSNGYKTSRDAYIYNFSREACAENARRMIGDYMGAMQVRDERPEYTIDEAAKGHSSNVRWDRELKNNLRRRRQVTFSANNVWKTQYRPFVKQHCYVEYILVNNKYQQDRVFPFDVGTIIEREREREREHNLAVCLPGVGSLKPFSAVIVDTMPDLEVVSKGQCFPRYRYQPRIASSARRARAPSNPSPSSSRTTCPTSTSSNSDSASPAGSIPHTGGIFDDLETELAPVDNITDTALAAFRTRYGDSSITKDAIFDYVYGLLHAPAYRERFANDLAKELPRIPFAQDFHAFAAAGSSLAELHLGYETCDQYPLDVEFSGQGELTDDHFRLGKRAMRLSADGSALMINQHIRLVGLPPEAHGYEVNGRTPLGWFIDRYRITQDKQSGIVNDPNEWFGNPRDLIAAIRRIVHVSVSTVAIVARLPDPFAEPE